MKIYNIIKRKLEKALEPSFIEIKDDSSKHKGHAGFKEGGETHFTIRIVSEKFAGLSKIQRHQLVYGILKEEMNNPIHALSLELRVRGED